MKFINVGMANKNDVQHFKQKPSWNNTKSGYKRVKLHCSLLSSLYHCHCCSINSSPCLISGNCNYVFGLFRAQLSAVRKWMRVCEVKKNLFPYLGLCQQRYMAPSDFTVISVLGITTHSTQSQLALKILISEEKSSWVLDELN